MEEVVQTEKLGDFDVHKCEIRDPKTGAVIRRNPYKLRAHKGVQYYEHPVGSGNLWWGSRKFAGQMVDGEIKVGEPHRAWSPPVSEDDKLVDRVVASEALNVQLKKELDDIKREAKYSTPAMTAAAKTAMTKPSEVIAPKPQVVIKGKR